MLHRANEYYVERRWKNNSENDRWWWRRWPKFVDLTLSREYSTFLSKYRLSPVVRFCVFFCNERITALANSSHTNITYNCSIIYQTAANTPYFIRITWKQSQAKTRRNMMGNHYSLPCETQGVGINWCRRQPGLRRLSRQQIANAKQVQVDRVLN